MAEPVAHKWRADAARPTGHRLRWTCRRLTRAADFQRVREEGQSWANRLVALHALPRQAGSTRVGLSVSRRQGGAVVRNRLRRRLREIVRAGQFCLVEGWDLVLAARGAAAEASFQELELAVSELLRRSGLWAVGSEAGEKPVDV